MKKTFIALSLFTLLFSGSAKPSHALFGVGDIVFDPASLGQSLIDYVIQGYQYVEDAATKKSTFINTATEVAEKVDTVMKDVQTAATMASIISSSKAVGNLILGDLGVDPLLVRKPGQYLENEGKKVLRGVIEDPEIQATLYDVSVMRSLIGQARYDAQNLNTKIKQINTSDIEAIVQQSYCTDEALSAQARKDVAASGNTSEEAYNDRKRALNQALCVGDAKSDPQTKANLREWNRQNPTWDSFLATTGGDNGWTKQQLTEQAIAERQKAVQDAKKADLAQGGGIKSEVECLEYVVPGNKATGCKKGKERIRKTSSALEQRYQDALSGPLKAQLASFGNAAGGLLSRVASIAGSAYTTKSLLENMSGNFGGGRPEEGDDTFGEGGVTNVAQTVSYRSDLASSQDLKRAITSAPMEQISSHKSSLQKLATINNSYILSVNQEKSSLDNMQACYGNLIATEPMLADDNRVQSANEFYGNKIGENRDLYENLMGEKEKVATGIQILSETERKIESSQSSEEIVSDFNKYNENFSKENIPGMAAHIQKEADYTLFKQDLETSLRENGEIWTYNNTCSQIRQEQASRNGNPWNNGGDGDGGGI